MKECKCYDIIDAINKKYTKEAWGHEPSCIEWREQSDKLIEKYLDGIMMCICPACGRIVCKLCAVRIHEGIIL